MDKLDKQSDEFVFKGAKLSLENAENHFEAGEILAGEDKLGLAVSHIILAAEECAKSILLLAKYYEGDIEQSDIPVDKTKIKEAYEDFDFGTLFYDHTPKQNVAVLISIFGQIMAELSPWPISIIDKILFQNEDLSKSDIEIIIETNEKQLRRIEDWKQTSIIPDLGLKDNSDWWKQVNDHKNNGFYVGFKNKKWMTPKDFTEQDYYIAHDNVSGMIALIDRYLEAQAFIDSYEQG